MQLTRAAFDPGSFGALLGASVFVYPMTYDGPDKIAGVPIEIPAYIEAGARTTGDIDQQRDSVTQLWVFTEVYLTDEIALHSPSELYRKCPMRIERFNGVCGVPGHWKVWL